MKPTAIPRRIVASLRGIRSETSTRLPTIGHRGLTNAISALAFVALVAVPAAAQDTGAAGDAFCDSGIGEIVGIALVLLSVGLGIFAAFRLSIGLLNMGSARQDKISDGRQQVKGAGLALMGALAPAAISAVLATLGIPTVECIDLGSYIGGGGVITPLMMLL